MNIEAVVDSCNVLGKDDPVIHLRRLLSHLLEQQSDVTLSSYQRNRIKKSISALNAGIEALQVMISA